MIAVITLGFDPQLQLGPLVLRWETVAMTVALLVALGAASLLAPSQSQLRLILVGIVPGAVVGGRIVHVIDFGGYYVVDPVAAIDPRVGSLSLLGAVIGGTLSAIYVCRLLRAPILRWADVAAFPLLLATGLGKLAQLMGGSGQGLPFDGVTATAFIGNGPWVSASPAMPAHPSQLYEAAWLLLGIPLLMALVGPRRLPAVVHPYVAWADRVAPAGRLFVGAVAWFLLGRIVVGFTWRDPQVAGLLKVEQLLALIVLGVGAAYFWARTSGRLARPVAVALCLLIAAGCGPSTTTAVPSGTASNTPAQASATPRGSPTLPTPSATPTAPPNTSSIDEQIAAMSLDEKVGQLFMTSFYGSDVTNVTAAQAKANRRVLGTTSLGEAIDRYHPGGVIYFTWSGNLTSASAAANLSNEVQARGAASNSGAPMLIATDQEGGSITRLPAPATQFAGNMAVGATGRIGMSRSVGQAIGEELRALGLNVALAPDADVNVNPANPIIGLRSFGSDPAAVSTMTAAMVGGFQGAGVAATIKHFPGHGDTDVDSHSQLPLITHTLEQWRTIDEPPFVAGIAAGADLVMAGHLAVPALDTSGTPSSLSEPILTGILREQLGFDGVVITDSLEMGALRTGYGDDRIPVLAILAGADILLMPPRLPVAFDAVKAAVQSGEISVARLDQSVRRILKLKEKLGLYEAAPVSVAAAGASLGTATHRTIERNVASASITLLANDNAVLPIAAATGAPYLVIGTASAPVLIVRDALRKRGVVAGTYVTGARPSNAVISAAVARAASYQTVIDLTLNADQDTQQQALVARLAATGKRIVTVAIGRPYDQAYYRAAVNLCTYSSSAASLQGAVRVILGEVGPVGRLPVMIPVAGAPSQVLYPLGFGLGYTP